MLAVSYAEGGEDDESVHVAGCFDSTSYAGVVVALLPANRRPFVPPYVCTMLRCTLAHHTALQGSNSGGKHDYEEPRKLARQECLTGRCGVVGQVVHVLRPRGR